MDKGKVKKSFDSYFQAANIPKVGTPSKEVPYLQEGCFRVTQSEEARPLKQIKKPFSGTKASFINPLGCIFV
jgi:hypothetical protein